MTEYNTDNLQITMSSIQSKMASHAKKVYNITHVYGKSQLIIFYPKMTEMLNLVNEDIKIAIINIFNIQKVRKT